MNALHTLMMVEAKYEVLQGVAPPTPLEREINAELRRLKEKLDRMLGGR